MIDIINHLLMNMIDGCGKRDIETRIDTLDILSSLPLSGPRFVIMGIVITCRMVRALMYCAIMCRGIMGQVRMCPHVLVWAGPLCAGPYIPSVPLLAGSVWVGPVLAPLGFYGPCPHYPGLYVPHWAIMRRAIMGCVWSVFAPMCPYWAGPLWVRPYSPHGPL